eukprot:5497602-Pleurochrysis_carterae.AAC.2
MRTTRLLRTRCEPTAVNGKRFERPGLREQGRGGRRVALTLGHYAVEAAVYSRWSSRGLWPS